MSKKKNRETNVDLGTVEGFGDEWVRFDQSELAEQDHKASFEMYFSVFPWHMLPKGRRNNKFTDSE